MAEKKYGEQRFRKSVTVDVSKEGERLSASIHRKLNDEINQQNLCLQPSFCFRSCPNFPKKTPSSTSFSSYMKTVFRFLYFHFFPVKSWRGGDSTASILCSASCFPTDELKFWLTPLHFCIVFFHVCLPQSTLENNSRDCACVNGGLTLVVPLLVFPSPPLWLFHTYLHTVVL